MPCQVTQALQQQILLIDEQKTNELNPLYSLANIMKHVTQLDTHSGSEHTGPAQQNIKIILFTIKWAKIFLLLQFHEVGLCGGHIYCL